MKDLLLSRKFWAVIITLLVMVLTALNAAFDLDQVKAVDFVVIAVSYIIGVAVDPGPGGWRGVLQSRKFWAAVLGFLVLMLEGFHISLPFNLTADQLTLLAVTIGAYIAGVTFEQPKILRFPGQLASMK